jgi:hypothetical protein
MFECTYCDTKYTSVNHYKTHVATKKHQINLAKTVSISNITDTQQTVNPKQITLLPEEQQLAQKHKFSCKCCNKVLASKFSLNRHYKICSSAQQLISENTMDIIDNLLDKTATGEDKQNITIVINNNNNITNNTNTNNNLNNINNNLNIGLSPDDSDDPDDKYAAFYELWSRYNVKPFGYENFDMLDNQAVADRIHGSGLNAFMEFISVLYSDKKNHNVALYNQREKLIKYLHSTGKVKITSLEKMLNDLVMNCIDGLDKFLDRKDISIKKSYKNIIDKLKLIHEQDGDNPYIDKYIGALKLVILNISSSALENMTAIEKVITQDFTEMEKNGRLVVPRSELRVNP